MDGRLARRLDESKLRLTQPSLAGSGPELGKNSAVNSGHYILTATPKGCAHTSLDKVIISNYIKVKTLKDGAVNTRASKGYLNLVLPPVPETDIRKNFFSHRVVPLWNSLPDHIKTAKTTNGFKASYDSFTGY